MLFLLINSGGTVGGFGGSSGTDTINGTTVIGSLGRKSHGGGGIDCVE